MNEIVIAWSMLLPEMFFTRALIVLGGAGMFLHYLCMASAAPKKSPWLVWGFLLSIGFFLIGMTACALSGNIVWMWRNLLGAFGSVVLFQLWLWAKGMHVKDFLEAKFGT